MANIRLKVIPTPAEGSATVFRTDKGKDFVFMNGEGPDNLLSGGCGKVLCKKMMKGQVQAIVFECPKCEAFNLT